MVKANLLYITLITTLSVTLSLAQSLRINEVVSSNSSFLDEDGDTPDWIELYNYGNIELSLEGMTLTDNPNDRKKWALPKITLGPDSYLIVFASDKDRNETGGYRTIINEGAQFSYYIPEVEIGTSWVLPDYDDSAWRLGASGFGYGDNDDVTIIPTRTQAVYLRKTFTLTDPQAIQNLILDIDYDDGFIAYLNGEYLCGNNLEGDPPAFDATATDDHEAAIYTGGKPERYELPAATALLENNNVLAIQVHNKSNTSSDMSLIPFLTALYSESTTEGIKPPVFLEYEEQEYHSNFKISSSGETIAIFAADGTLVDSLVVPDLNADVSIGSTDNSALGYFSEPTPGTYNYSESHSGILDDNLVFSKGSGVTSAFSLTLSGADSTETIRYTLDGSVPRATSARYTSPIPINSITIVRARKFKTGFLPSDIQSHSYLLGVDHDLPVISLVVDPDDMFGEENGIYSYGNDYNADFPHFGANFWKDREKPVNISFYNEDGKFEYGLDGGIKIFGGFSRAWDQRSLSIFARKHYGEGKIDYPVFDALEYDSFNSIVLRNSGNDWVNTNIRDGFMTTLMSDSGLETQAWQPYVTYINGEYWGIYNAREKINEHFLAQKSGIDKDDLDFLELKGEIKHGSNTDYLALYDFIENNDLTVPANYQLVSEQIDLENYALYYTTQVYYGNRDWPGNNLKYWRPKGGKWRWVLFDTEIGFGLWEVERYLDNTLADVLDPIGEDWPNPPWSTLIFRKLMENKNFKILFANQMADEMNSRFLADNINNHIDSIKSYIETEVPAHFNRWGGSPSNWNYQIRNLYTYADKRATQVKEHLLSELELPAYHELKIVNQETERGYVVINNRLRIGQPLWTGDYFEEIPFSLTAVARPGYVFSHWIQGSSSAEANIELLLSARKTVQPKFVKDGTASSEVNNKPEIKIYPNPISDLLNINISNYFLERATIRLVDSKGVVLKTLVENTTITSLEHQENISALPKGTYFIELVVESRPTQAFKVVKI